MYYKKLILTLFCCPQKFGNEQEKLNFWLYFTRVHIRSDKNNHCVYYDIIINVISHYSWMFEIRGPNVQDNSSRLRANMSIYCIYCGTELPNIAKFCFTCGKVPKGELVVSEGPDIANNSEKLSEADVDTSDPLVKNHVKEKPRRAGGIPVRTTREASSWYTVVDEPDIAFEDSYEEDPFFDELDEPDVLDENYRQTLESDNKASPRPSQTLPRRSTVPQRKLPTRRTSTDKLISNIRKTEPSNTREVATSQLELINRYRNNVLQQAQRSFTAALVAASVGLIFFFAAVSLVFFKLPATVSIISVIGGTLVYVISAINFYLYRHASDQLASFHVFIDRTLRFILAESFCENLEDSQVRDSTRSELVRNVIKTSKLQKFDTLKSDELPKAMEDIADQS